jgi:Tol biopolymer transport system component/DNA-binding winged helix-turn-helix (wHTH) protein
MMPSKSFVFHFDDVEVREREFTLIKAGKVLPVEPKAFRTLLFLLHNPQRLIAKEELLNTVWGDAAVTEGSLTRCIWLLRSALGDDIHQPRYIKTVATVGYRFVCKVEVSEDLHGGPAPADLPDGGGGGKRPDLSTQAAGGAIWSFRQWWLLAAAVLAVGLVSTIWYLHRPLPPPRIASYIQITHDGRRKWLAGVDASRLYANEITSSSIEQVPIEGGELAQIPVPVPGGPGEMLDISPDGSHLLTGTAEEGKPLGPIWNVRIQDGSYRRLGDAWDAAYSRDGSSVVYTNLEGDIWLVQSDGTGAHKLGSAAGKADWPQWSPDGGAIGFSLNNRLWEISSSGSNPHPLLPGWHASSTASGGHWTPDGKFLVFTSHESMAVADQIWAIDERSGVLRQPPAEPVQLTTGPTSWSVPFPSRDGKKIFACGATLRGELSRVDPATKEIKPFLGGISAHNVSFSRDGRFIAYVSFPQGVLWKANRDGSNPVQLTDLPMNVGRPRWSPDGSQILFVAASAGHIYGYTVTSEGGIPKRILPEDNGRQGDPDWSPDGKKIVFDSASARNAETGDLRLLDLDSRQVTVVPGSAGTWSPRWSPDGRFIAALSWKTSILKVFDIETQRWSALPVKGLARYPAFSRDSHYIYYIYVLYSHKSDAGIFRIPVKGGEVELVADLKDWHPGADYQLEPLDPWMDLDPTDAPLLLRDTGTEDIYALTLDEK